MYRSNAKEQNQKKKYNSFLCVENKSEVAQFKSSKMRLHDI